jgi:3-hydroxyisobutyrate dehydrogenase
VIGVVGTGLMGYPIAKRLLAAGYPVVVWNRTRERALPLAREGAAVAESVAELAEKSELALVVVSDDEASASVLERLTSAKRGLDVVNHSTVTPMHARWAHGLCRERGCRYLTLTVMGGPTEAERGELVGMAGGDREVLDRWGEAIGRYVREVVYVGSAEAAAALKLAINSIYFSSMVSVAEALLLAERWGVGYEKFREVADKLWIKVLLDRYAGRLLSEKQPLRFRMRLAAKDMLYAVLAGFSKGQPLPHITAIAQTFLEAATIGGLGEEDYTRVYRFLRSFQADEATSTRSG